MASGPFTVEVYGPDGMWMSIEGEDVDRYEVLDMGILRLYIVESGGTSVTDYPQHAWFGLQRTVPTQPPPPDVPI